MRSWSCRSSRPVRPVLLFLLLVACGQAPEARKQEALARGERYLADRKPNEAIIEFQNALQVDPELGSALHGLGRAYAIKYWYFDAVRELARAQRLAPDSIPIAVDLGHALVETGDWVGAEEQARAILGVDPQNRDALYIKGAARLREGDVDEALRVLDAVPGGESFPAHEIARAEALLGLDRTEQAEQVVRGALARHPDDARSIAAAAVVELARERYAEAEQLYARARDRDPENPRIRLGLAAARARQGRLAEAIEELEAVSPRARTGAVLRALARYYLDARRPGDAVTMLAPVVRQYPRYASGRLLLALALLANEEPERARAELEMLERQRPEDPVVQLHLAGAYLRLNRPHDALARLGPLTAAFEDEPEYHLERGRALAMLGRLDEAERAAATALRVAPETPQAYVLLGEIRQQRGDAATAREMLTTAASLAADFVPARLALGRLLLAERDPEAALREFEAALDAEQRSLPAAQMKALVLAEVGRTPEAISFVEELVGAEPGLRGFHALLGALHAMELRWDRANLAYRKELELDPKSVVARLGLASAALAQGYEDEAVSYLREVVTVHPGHVSATLLLASLYSRHGRANLAVPLLETAARSAPHQTSVSVMLADLHVKTGRPEEAIAIAGRVLEAHPTHWKARMVRGQAALARGDGAAAVRDFQAVAGADPGSAEARYHLAQAQRMLGRTAEARAGYRDALRLDPSMELARIELASLEGEAPDGTALRAEIDRLRASMEADPRDATRREALTRTLLAAGRIREARQELHALLEYAPLHVGANVLSARLLLEAGEEAAAAARLQAVLTSTPDHLEARLLLGRHLRRRGLLDDAIPHLEAAAAGDPHRLDIGYELGTAYVSAGRLDGAMSIARQLEQSQPRDPRPALLRGAVSIERRDFAGALDAFEAAARLDPQLADAHRGAGLAYEGLRQPARAAAAYRRALALQGDDPVALNNLAWVLAEDLGRPDEALPLAEQAVRLDPRSGEMLDTLGRIHYRRGNYAKAVELLREAARRLPRSAAVHYHLGLAYTKLGQRDDAASVLRRAAQLDAAFAEAERLDVLIRTLEQ